MRITTPDPAARIDLDNVDLADPDLYTSGDAHLVWQTLREQQPVFWQSSASGPGFWAVTRWADVRRVLSEHETFSSEHGTAISMLGAPDPAAGMMMQATDPPRHQQLRKQLGKPFSSSAMPAYTEYVQSYVRDIVDSAADGEVWDVSEKFSRLPMATGALLMGLPTADIDPLLQLAYASLAPRDPKFSQGRAAPTERVAHYKLLAYFGDRIAERRKNPSDDVITHMMNIEWEGRPLTDLELLVNCVSLVLGAVVTTSHAISATLVALAGQHGGEGRWPANVPLESTVEEALRWSSPVTHFMRRARVDTDIRGTKIRAGEAVTAWIASGNRDEAMFDQPYVLDLERAPNRHIVFGSGSHLCLGSNLARLMLQHSFRELSARVESFEVAGPPRHLASNEIAGMVSLPLRVRLRPRHG
jgi:cytochrome P450